MLVFKYISYHFLKYFFIILTALTLFAVSFEYTTTVGELASSANLLVIFLVYKIFFAIDMLVPISLVLAMISTKVFLIRSNALVSFYSLGYSKVQVLNPFVIVSVVVTLLYISLHTSSSFAKANEFANNIKNNSEYLSPSRDLFFSYKNKFVYFSKLLPLQSSAEGIRIFSIDNGSLKEVITADFAVYKDGFWHIKYADIIIKPNSLKYDSLGITLKNNKNLKLLEGFRPKMLDQVYEGKANFTIWDAVEALLILKEHNVDIQNIKSALYKILIYPFFAPCLVVIIFFFVPISSRNLNISLFSFGAILSTLMIWGIMFMLLEFAKNKTIPAEIGIILPVIILFSIALRQWQKYRLRS
ncbi:MAG: LptF/LptG family permease [Sulfurimonas sp.]|nr:LptF/LptG family permease [Sulfurimonas sp.]